MRYAIGIDVGGTKIEAALVDEQGNALASSRVPTPAGKGWDQILASIDAAIDEVSKKDHEGIGLGTPGFIHENQMGSNPNIPELAKALGEFTKKYPEAVIENDANCFALAEHKWGAARDKDNVIGLIWGTGIGAGIMIDGKLLHGAAGGAGEVGQATIAESGQPYELGGPGTWEYLCSGPNIVRRYKEAGGAMEDPRPDKIFNSKEDAAVKIRKETLKYMGVGLGNLASILNPEVIVLGGGVSNLNVHDELDNLMKKYSVPMSGKACKVVKNRLGDSSGVLGAASLVFEKQ